MPSEIVHHPAEVATPFLKNRVALLKFLIICLPLWVSIKFYDGPAYNMVHNYFSNILFIISWALLIQLVLPKLPETPILIGLFMIFAAIELTSWLVPEIFSGVSLSLFGVQVIGSKFSLHKIPYYGVGAFIGYFILKACRTR